MKKINIDRPILIFSRSVNFIEICNQRFKNIKIISDKLNTKDKQILKKKKISVNIIKNHKDMYKILKKHNELELGLSYGFGIIFKKKIIKKFKNGIWNLHSSILPNYRGRHPISYAILNDEKKIGATIHKINEKIDLGYTLSNGSVARNLRDDENIIKNKILNLFRKKLLSRAIKNFKKNKIYKIKNKGKYYPPLLNGIEIKNSKMYNAKYLFNAIYSQKSFGGAKIQNKKYTDAYFISSKRTKSYVKKGYKILISKDKIYLAVK